MIFIKNNYFCPFLCYFILCIGFSGFFESYWPENDVKKTFYLLNYLIAVFHMFT